MIFAAQMASSEYQAMPPKIADGIARWPLPMSNPPDATPIRPTAAPASSGHIHSGPRDTRLGAVVHRYAVEYAAETRPHAMPRSGYSITLARGCVSATTADRKIGWSPRNGRTVSAPTTLAMTTGLNAPTEKLPSTSSSAKKAPAKGALNAPAIPAAAP